MASSQAFSQASSNMKSVTAAPMQHANAHSHTHRQKGTPACTYPARCIRQSTAFSRVSLINAC
eukprot:scaffold104012_cov21-Tisochrysis_lutea.AAC.2